MSKFYRRVIRITALDSPNVIAKRNVLPGLLSWDEYQRRLATWDEVRQCIGLMGQFYEGAELLLFPPEWLNRAEVYAANRPAINGDDRYMGIDPGEGGANTCTSVIDKHGILELHSVRTPNTDDIIGNTLYMMQKWHVKPERIYFDRGGGGKQHADRLIAKGYKVNSIGFGESVSLEPKRTRHQLPDRLDIRGERYIYKNRRAQMYGDFSDILDPASEQSFGIPAQYSELRRQLALIPRLTDEEGRMYLPSKNKRDDKDTRRTLIDIIGRSPDEADATVLAVFGMLHGRIHSKVWVA
jgi:hypothetical protein